MLRKWFCFTVIAVLLSACGGGGGGSSAPATTPTTPPATGSLTVLLGDGPVADYDGFLLHIDRVVLLGDDGQDDVVLKDTPSVVDLLELRNITELLIDEEVVAGTYSKIRLEVSRIEAITRDDDGNVLESVDVDVPANGKIDLNPQGDFEIAEGDDLVVEVDIDLERSVRVHETGNGLLKFRPVVFVRILDALERQRLIRLFGQIDNIADDGFDLCRIDRLSDRVDEPVDRCVPVEIADDVRVFDAAGMPIDFADLANGDMVTVFGRVRFGTESETVIAHVIASGEAGAFAHIGGVVTSPLTDGAFEVSRESRETDELRSRTVELVDRALILDDDGQPTPDTAIVEGAEVEVFGVDVDGGNFVGIIVWIDSEDEPEVVSGQVVSINLADSTLTLENDDGRQCVAFDDDTTFLQVVEDDETAEVMELSVEDLADGLTAEAFGEPGEECLAADEIVFETATE